MRRLGLCSALCEMVPKFMCNGEKGDWAAEGGQAYFSWLQCVVFFCSSHERSSLFLFKSRLLMEELVNFIERVPKAQSASLWKNKDIQR